MTADARVSRPLIFIAYTLPAEAASALATWVEEALGGADAVRLVPAANLHITLVFCGRLPDDRVDEVIERTRAAIAVDRAPLVCAHPRASARARGDCPRIGGGRARSSAARLATGDA